MLYLSHGDGDANLCRRDCGGPWKVYAFFNGALASESPAIIGCHDIVAEEIENRYLTTTRAWFDLMSSKCVVYL